MKIVQVVCLNTLQPMSLKVIQAMSLNTFQARSLKVIQAVSLKIHPIRYETLFQELFTMIILIFKIRSLSPALSKMALLVRYSTDESLSPLP